MEFWFNCTKIGQLGGSISSSSTVVVAAVVAVVVKLFDGYYYYFQLSAYSANSPFLLFHVHRNFICVVFHPSRDIA